MASDYVSSFRTYSPDPYTGGPGGPILILTNAANSFSMYYAEILLAEGLNQFALKDLSSINAATLAAYDVVILGQTSLTAAQVTALSDWVNAGGNLIAMRPDKQLAGLLGVQIVFDLEPHLPRETLRVPADQQVMVGVIHHRFGHQRRRADAFAGCEGRDGSDGPSPTGGQGSAAVRAKHGLQDRRGSQHRRIPPRLARVEA